jgi:hypothetical protein
MPFTAVIFNWLVIVWLIVVKVLIPSVSDAPYFVSSLLDDDIRGTKVVGGGGFLITSRIFRETEISSFGMWVTRVVM